MNGSDPLAALRPLHAPPPVSWWPPAPGWWLFLLLIPVIALLVLRWRRRRAPQRAALRELEALKSLSDSPRGQAASVNRLLKRYALVCWPAGEVASLTGEPWLAFLDAHGGQGDFLRGPGRALLTLPYGGRVERSDQLLALARRWIRANRPGSGS